VKLVFYPKEIGFKDKVKVRGDAGEYDVLGIDWLNQKVYVYRASECVWLLFSRISRLIPSADQRPTADAEFADK
jgi:hypothetical protein